MVERLAGRTIPGVGAVAFAADALDLLSAITRPGTLAGLPGNRGKRDLLNKGRATRRGYVGRIEDARRFRELDSRARGMVGPGPRRGVTPPRDFRVGVGDILQGLQATDSIFGTGIQLGPIVGFLQDAFWGVVRGATFQARGPLQDPLGFTAAGRAACTRSPRLESVHSSAYYVLANEALALWSKAGRVMPWIDRLPEVALASTLVGLRLAENVLGPWIRKGEWIPMLGQMLQEDPVVAGGVAELGTRGLRASEWIDRTVPSSVAAINRALEGVADKGRQALYESLVSSIAWGFVGSLEPAGRVREQSIVGPALDATLIAETNRFPRQDLVD